MLEVDVHQQLHAFLREQGEWPWPHQLTVARLVARAFRLQRSALIQISAAAKFQGHYRFSYLVPLMLCPQPVMLVAPTAIQQYLLRVALPRLSEGLGLQKAVCLLEQWTGQAFPGILMVSPHQWLSHHLGKQHLFPQGMLTVVDSADAIEAWTRQYLTVSLRVQDWEQLQWCYPHLRDDLCSSRAQLTHSIFQHPANPYNCVLIGQPERQILRTVQQLLATEDGQHCPPGWRQLWQRLAQASEVVWAEVNREQGTFVIHCAPVEVHGYLQPLWSQQPVVLLGGIVDEEPSAPLFRQRIGLDELTCVQFAADRQAEVIQLYLPDGLPMPNTPEFQDRLVAQIHRLLEVTQETTEPTVLIIDELPLKTQVAALLAATLGSHVQVEVSPPQPAKVLVTGWDFWLQVQQRYPAPSLLIIATLPIPSLEDPRVAGRVACFKRRRLDWFRLYLLPEALRRLEDAIAPVRARQGVVALLDNRVLHRSYGKRVLSTLSPYARLNYIDASLFKHQATLNPNA